jgi:hypothetical protein
MRRLGKGSERLWSHRLCGARPAGPSSSNRMEVSPTEIACHLRLPQVIDSRDPRGGGHTRLRSSAIDPQPSYGRPGPRKGSSSRLLHHRGSKAAPHGERRREGTGSPSAGKRGQQSPSPGRAGQTRPQRRGHGLYFPVPPAPGEAARGPLKREGLLKGCLQARPCRSMSSRTRPLERRGVRLCDRYQRRPFTVAPNLEDLPIPLAPPGQV